MSAIPSLPDGWHRSPRADKRLGRPLWALFERGAPVALIERKGGRWEILPATAILEGHGRADDFESARQFAEQALRKNTRSGVWLGHIARCWAEEIA